MPSIAPRAPERKIIVGVDTHTHLHVAVALNTLGVRIGERTVAAGTAGYAELES